MIIGRAVSHSQSGYLIDCLLYVCGLMFFFFSLFLSFSPRFPEVMNMGGLSTPDETGPFLQRLFQDRDIIELPGGPFVQKYLGEFIAKRRTSVKKKKYASHGAATQMCSRGHWWSSHGSTGPIMIVVLHAHQYSYSEREPTRHLYIKEAATFMLT